MRQKVAQYYVKYGFEINALLMMWLASFFVC